MQSKFSPLLLHEHNKTFETSVLQTTHPGVAEEAHVKQQHCRQQHHRENQGQEQNAGQHHTQVPDDEHRPTGHTAAPAPAAAPRAAPAVGHRRGQHLHPLPDPELLLFLLLAWTAIVQVHIHTTHPAGERKSRWNVLIQTVDVLIQLMHKGYNNCTRLRCFKCICDKLLKITKLSIGHFLACNHFHVESHTKHVLWCFLSRLDAVWFSLCEHTEL